RQRLAIGPAFARDGPRWADPALQTAIRRSVDARGLVRENSWHAGASNEAPHMMASIVTGRDPQIAVSLGMVAQGEELNKAQITRLFTAEGRDFDYVRAFADELREDRVGKTITHVVNRNINYTNICLYRCGFCAFSKGSTHSE